MTSRGAWKPRFQLQPQVFDPILGSTHTNDSSLSRRPRSSLKIIQAKCATRCHCHTTDFSIKTQTPEHDKPLQQDRACGLGLMDSNGFLP